MNTPPHPARSLLGLLAWCALLAAAAALASIASVEASGFYAILVRPDWAPPGWIFGPVWTVLYAMMAVAAWLVWRESGSPMVGAALALFLAQLALNVLWSWLFFTWRLGLASVIEIGLLWLTVAGSVIAFWRVRPLAGALLLPYLAWVKYAAALNLTVWRLNPGLLG